jgi:hypothetical protein
MLGRAMESIRQCTRNVVQVIGQALRGRIEQAALRNSGQAISAGDRRDIDEKIAAEVGVQGLRDKVGHAEERLILAWPDIMEDYSHARDGEQPDTAKLYLPDSPCTVHDGNKASDNISGEPRSCFAKINLLISDISGDKKRCAVLEYLADEGVMQVTEPPKLPLSPNSRNPCLTTSICSSITTDRLNPDRHYCG